MKNSFPSFSLQPAAARVVADAECRRRSQEKKLLRYVDAATLTVIGKSTPTPKPFQRVDTAQP